MEIPKIPLNIQRNQKGCVHILVVIAALAVISFIVISEFVPIKSVLKDLYNKKISFAAAPGITILDQNNQPITETTNPNIKVSLTSPWLIARGGVNLINTAFAQSTSTTTLTKQVSSSSDDVNQDGNNVDTSSSTVWIGTGQSTTSSYTGLRFSGINITKNTTIRSAKLQFFSPLSQWITVAYIIKGDASGNSSTFSSQSSPSQRTLTSASTNSNTNVKWDANNWYDGADVTSIVQEIVNRSDWGANNLSLILKGTGSAYGRKQAVSFNGNAANAPKLIITYSGIPSVNTPTPLPTIAGVSPTPTPVIKLASVSIAEDSNFTKNVKNFGAFTSDNMIFDYTLSSTGNKIIYAKFISNIGTNQLYQTTITYNLPQATPTTIPVTSITPTPTMAMGGGTNSAAMGIWNPNTKFDTCPTYPSGVVSDQDKINYIKSIHDSYKVKGPDGKWYPTWHPAVDPKTGCKFGHEHGQDPSTANNWSQVKDHYAFVNPDGSKDLAEAGIPFAYVNEQMDVWTAANNNSIAMRHEDHVGHKVAIANNFQIGLDNSTTGAQFFYQGVTCNYIVKVHQGTHSKDAFENNLHEVLYNVSCSDGHTINLDTMGEFGKAGQFTRSCDSASDRSSIIKTGFDYSNANYPSSSDPNNTRGISDRSCIETGFLVPQGTFSQNPYEFWPVSTSLIKSNGTPVADGLNLLFDVEDSVRYYYPGHTDPVSGLVDNLGHMQDLCYENLNGRTFRGNICDNSTKFGSIKGITWDDPRAGFRDLNRGTYFKPGVSHNAGGPTVWYSDPFGNHAQNTPFTGSLKQFVSADSTNYAQKANAFETANVINMVHDDGHGTVHAPN